MKPYTTPFEKSIKITLTQETITAIQAIALPVYNCANDFISSCIFIYNNCKNKSENPENFCVTANVNCGQSVIQYFKSDEAKAIFFSPDAAEFIEQVIYRYNQ